MGQRDDRHPDPIELFGQDWLTRSTERSRHVDALAP